MQALLREERKARAKGIASVPLNTQLVHGIVRQYLLHYAYRDTLAAFDSDTGGSMALYVCMGGCTTSDGSMGWVHGTVRHMMGWVRGIGNNGSGKSPPHTHTHIDDVDGDIDMLCTTCTGYGDGDT